MPQSIFDQVDRATASLFDRVDAAMQPPAAAAAPPPKTVGDYLVEGVNGVRKGFLGTVSNLGQAARDYVPGVAKLDSVMTPIQVDTTARTPAEKVGKLAEQTAEFMVPESLLGDAAKLVPNAGKVAKFVAAHPMAVRSAAQGAEALAVGSAQTGKAPSLSVGSLAPAVIAASGPVVSAAVRPAAELIYNSALKTPTSDLVESALSKGLGNVAAGKTPAQIGLDLGVIPTPGGVGRAMSKSVKQKVGETLESPVDTRALLGTLGVELQQVRDALGRFVGENSRVADLARQKQLLSGLQSLDNTAPVNFLIPQELKTLANALPPVGRRYTDNFGGVGVPQSIAAGIGYLGGGIPGAVGSFVAGRLAKAPSVRGGAAILLDQLAKHLPANALAGATSQFTQGDDTVTGLLQKLGLAPVSSH